MQFITQCTDEEQANAVYDQLQEFAGSGRIEINLSKSIAATLQVRSEYTKTNAKKEPLDIKWSVEFQMELFPGRK